MKRFLPMREATLICLSWLVLGQVTGAAAQPVDPAFQFGKLEEVKKAVWKASAQAGLLLATGNSNSLTVSAGGSVSRVDAKNKIALDLEGRFGRTTVFAAKPGLPTVMGGAMDGTAIISSYDDITTATAVTTQYWSAKLRYDRFFSKNNLGYITGQVAGDEPAGKRVFGGGQIGYSRQIYKSERNEFLGEVGYDVTFIRLSSPPDSALINIHSLRAFLGYNLTLSKDTAVNSGIEALFNLNVYNSPGFVNEIAPFQDTRINFRTALNTKLHKNVSFRFAFKVRFDNVPAPRPAIAGTSYGVIPGSITAENPTGTVFTPIAERVDTLSEAALIVNFL